jgi:transcriptional regulator of acetoin/glycerol metabolism
MLSSLRHRPPDKRTFRLQLHCFTGNAASRDRNLSRNLRSPSTPHFINIYGNGHRVTDEVLDALLEYEWPGNVRELKPEVETRAIQPIRYTKGDHPVDPALLGIGRTTLYRKLEEYGL